MAYAQLPGSETQADKLERFLKTTDEKEESSDPLKNVKLSLIRQNRKSYNHTHPYYSDNRNKFLDPEYKLIIEAVILGATLTEVRKALSDAHILEHDQIKRLLKDGEQKHANIQQFRKEFYLEKIKEEINKVSLRKSEPQQIAAQIDRYTLSAVNNGTTLAELCNTLKAIHYKDLQVDYTPIDRLTKNKNNDNNPEVTRIKKEIQETEVILLIKKLLNLSISPQLFSDDKNRQRVENELLIECKKLADMGGDIEKLLQSFPNLPLPTHNKIKEALNPQRNILNL